MIEAKSSSEIPVLDHGFVCLDESSAKDLDVVNAARVSFNTHHESMEEGDDKLIGYLLRNKHGTPFEHNFFRFRIKAPIFVFREWHRHRIGHSYNEWSARYSELKNEFYIPEYVRTQVGKPGAYTYQPADEDDSKWFRGYLSEHCERSFQAYREALEAGIAKEQARLFLPVNIYSEMYWSCNARSLMHFLSLRNTTHAMHEIQLYATIIERVFENQMPITAEAFKLNNRVAP